MILPALPDLPPPLPFVADADFQATVAAIESSLEVRLAGTADLNVRKQLDAFLSTVHTLATDQTITTVTVDMRSLEFMNSSCLKGLVSWIGTVHDAAPDCQYRIVFIAKAGSRWQRRSLYAISCVAAQLVSVQD